MSIRTWKWIFINDPVGELMTRSLNLKTWNSAFKLIPLLMIRCLLKECDVLCIIQNCHLDLPDNFYFRIWKGNQKFYMDRLSRLVHFVIICNDIINEKSKCLKRNYKKCHKISNNAKIWKKKYQKWRNIKNIENDESLKCEKV